MVSYNTERDHSPTNRRTFCTELLLTSAGVALALSHVNSASGATQQSMVAYSPRKIDGAATLLPGSGLYFDYPTRNDPAVLLRSQDGEYMAYARRCSHAGCSVELDSSAQCLRCPCHRGVFEGRTGDVILGPPRKRLDEIVLQMRAGGQVWAIGKSFGSLEIAQDVKRGER